MSSTYGPIIFSTLGKLVTASIFQESTSLIVENQSLNDIILSVNPVQPQIITQAQAQSLVAAGQPVVNGGWDLHIGPRETGVLEIPDAYLLQSPRGGYWTGTVWMEMLQITNALVAAGSIVSNPGPNVWITSYGPGEQVPAVGINNLGFFLASQERQVAIPVSPSIQGLGQITASATSTFTNITSGSSIGNFPFSNSAITAGLVTAGTFYTLLYSFYANMVNLSGVAGTAESQSYQCRWIVQDNAAATVGTSGLFAFGFMAHLALQSQAETVNNPAYPLAFPITCSAGAGSPYTLIPQFAVFNVTGGGGTNIKSMIFNVWYDIAGLFTNGPSGGLGGLPTGGVYTGFVY